MYSTEFLLNKATIREVKLNYNWLLLLKIVWWEKHRITRHYNAELQTTTQTLRATKYSIESTYSDLPCDLKVNRGKLALIYHPWKCKKGKDRRSPLVNSRKLAKYDISSALFPAVTVTVVRDRKIRTALRTNQIAGIVKMPSLKKLKTSINDHELFFDKTSSYVYACMEQRSLQYF